MRVMQRWAKQPGCATLSLAAGAAGNISFATSKVAADRCFISTDVDGTLLWSTTTDLSAISDPTTGNQQIACGKRRMQAGVTQPFEVEKGTTIWYFKNVGAATIILSIEFGFSAAFAS